MIENGVHNVRDGTDAEDRLHARLTTHLLAALRNAALKLIRPIGFAFVPGAHCSLVATAHLGVPLLSGLLEH